MSDEDIRRVLGRALEEEPPLGINAEQAIREGRRRKTRRYAVVTATASGVLALSVSAAVAGGISQGPAEPAGPAVYTPASCLPSEGPGFPSGSDYTPAPRSPKAPTPADEPRYTERPGTSAPGTPPGGRYRTEVPDRPAKPAPPTEPRYTTKPPEPCPTDEPTSSRTPAPRPGTPGPSPGPTGEPTAPTTEPTASPVPPSPTSSSPTQPAPAQPGPPATESPTR